MSGSTATPSRLDALTSLDLQHHPYRALVRLV